MLEGPETKNHLLAHRNPLRFTLTIMTSLMLAGLGIAGAAFGARFLMQSFKQIQKHASKLPNSPLFTAYYKGGFDPKMTRREAWLILGKSNAAHGHCCCQLQNLRIQFQISEYQILKQHSNTVLPFTPLMVGFTGLFNCFQEFHKLIIPT